MSLAVIAELLDDPNITEIMINSWDKIFVELNGTIFPSQRKFDNAKDLYDFSYFLLNEDKKQIGKGLVFNGFYKNMFRYNIVLPPMAPKGPLITIRKFIKRIFTFDDLIQRQVLTNRAAIFLAKSIQARLNIVISGGTGTGKTSLLNTLCNYVPNQQRIITIEAVLEISINTPNWVQIQTQIEPLKLTSRDCLVNALRMRPDRIIIGECRSDEAFEMLQAMNTGHEGSMTTIHANSAIESLSRLESLILVSGLEIPVKSIRKLISQSVHLIVQLQRLADGRRIISEILEVSGMEGDTITRAVLFSLDKNQELVPSGILPKCSQQIENKSGTPFPVRFFDPNYILPI